VTHRAAVLGQVPGQGRECPRGSLHRTPLVDQRQGEERDQCIVESVLVNAGGDLLLEQGESLAGPAEIAQGARQLDDGAWAAPGIQAGTQRPGIQRFRLGFTAHEVEDRCLLVRGGGIVGRSLGDQFADRCADIVLGSVARRSPDLGDLSFPVFSSVVHPLTLSVASTAPARNRPIGPLERKSWDFGLARLGRSALLAHRPVL